MLVCEDNSLHPVALRPQASRSDTFHLSHFPPILPHSPPHLSRLNARQLWESGKSKSQVRVIGASQVGTAPSLVTNQLPKRRWLDNDGVQEQNMRALPLLPFLLPLSPLPHSSFLVPRRISTIFRFSDCVDCCSNSPVSQPYTCAIV